MNDVVTASASSERTDRDRESFTERDGAGGVLPPVGGDRSEAVSPTLTQDLAA